MRESRRKRKRRGKKEKEGEEEKVEEEGEEEGEGGGGGEGGKGGGGGKHYRGLDCEWPPVSSLSRAAPKCVSQAEGRSQPGLRSRISRRAENWSERRRGEARRTQGAL